MKTIRCGLTKKKVAKEQWPVPSQVLFAPAAADTGRSLSCLAAVVEYTEASWIAAAGVAAGGIVGDGAARSVSWRDG